MMRIRLTEFPNLSANELRVPNGVGSWSVDKFGIAYAEGAFLMYVEKINPHVKSIRTMKGSIFDINGEASFTGSLGVEPLNFIEFVKEYGLEASKRASTNEKNVKWKYRGYLVSEEIKGNLYEGNFSSAKAEPIEGSDLRFLLRLKI